MSTPLLSFLRKNTQKKWRFLLALLALLLLLIGLQLRSSGSYQKTNERSLIASLTHMLTLTESPEKIFSTIKGARESGTEGDELSADLSFANQAEFYPDQLLKNQAGSSSPTPQNSIKLTISITGRLVKTNLGMEGNALKSFYIRFEELSPPIKITSGTSEATKVAEKLSTLLARGFIVVASSEGILKELITASPCDELELNTLKMVLGFTEGLTLPKSAEESTYVREESDPIGRYRAEYQLQLDKEPPSIEKRKTEYLTLFASTTEQKESLHAEVKSSTIYSFDPNQNGRLNQITGGELVTTYLPSNAPLGESRTDFSLKTVEYRSMDRDAVATLKAKIKNDFLQNPFSYSLSKKAPTIDMTSSQYQELLGEATFEDLMSELKGMSATPHGESVTIDTYLRLKAFVTLKGDQINRLIAALAPYNAESEEFRLWVRALSSIGDAKSQEVMISMFQAPSSNHEVKSTLIHALAMVPVAEKGTEALIRAMAASNNDPELKSEATLALGILSGKLHNKALETGEAELRERADALMEEGKINLQKATTIDEKKFGLSQLGNMGREETIEVIEPFLSRQTSSDLRANAAMSLRLIKSPKASHLLKNAVKNDPDLEVKLAAIRALSYQELPIPLFHDLITLCESTESSPLSTALFNLIVANRTKHPGVVNFFLEEMSSHSSSPRLAEEARRLLNETN